MLEVGKQGKGAQRTAGSILTKGESLQLPTNKTQIYATHSDWDTTVAPMNKFYPVDCLVSMIHTLILKIDGCIQCFEETVVVVVYINASLVPRPSRPSICRLQWEGLVKLSHVV